MTMTNQADRIKKNQTKAELPEQTAKLRRMTEELSLAEERERQRIAMDVHDGIGQTLAMMKMKLTELKNTVHSPELTGRITEILEYTDQAIREIRSLSHELSPAVLYSLGLEAAMENLADKIMEKHSLHIEFVNDPQPKPLAEASRIHLYRSVRELLFNVIKHSGAQQVKITISRENNEIRIAVEDKGCGFDCCRPDFQEGICGGFGLFSIRERLEHLGGNFVIHSEVGKGTRVLLSAPLSAPI